MLMSKADISICAMAITWRVMDAPGQTRVSQMGNRLIGVDVNLLLLFLEQLFSAPGQFFFYRKHSVAFPCSPRFLSAQPKTDVCARTLVRLSIKETIALSPVLSPEWPREAVIPPLKSKRPLGSKRNV